MRTGWMIRICGGLAPMVMLAQSSGHIGGPQFLANVDGKNEIRPILGVAAASSIGPRLSFAHDFAQVALGPVQDYVLAQKSDGGWYLIANPFTASTANAVVLDASIQGERVIFSRSGSAVMIGSAGAGSAVAVLSELPKASPNLQSVLLPDAVAMAAVSDDGSTVLGIAHADDHDSVWVVAAGRQTMVGSFHRVTATVFLPNSNDALVLDGGQDALFIVRDAGQRNEMLNLAGHDQGIRSASAMTTSGDGKRVYVAVGEPTGVVTIPVDGTAVVEFTACICSPSELSPLGADLFVVGGRKEAGALWMFSRSMDGGRTYFVPRPVEDAQ